jgi:putative secretion ATPase (PEP-CTERM system associated)
MYEQFFNLTAEPFRLSPDHRFCYNHAQYAKAKAYMAYAFMRAEGFVMVTGQPGTGKTTLIGDLVESLADENVAVANLVSTQLAADDLLRMVAFAFGLTTESTDKSSVLQQLNTRFLALHRAGGRALLIVDEAQDLNHQAMEELRLLTNLQLDGKPLLQIFLLGQPELRDLIHDPALEQVHQRIIATSNLRALEEEETRAYVEHRLHVVGWQNNPAISAAVFPIIYSFSEGIPRRINLICSRLFLHTFVEQRHQIGVADARTVVEELQDEQLSTRNLLNDDLFYAQDVYDSPLPEDQLQAVTSTRLDEIPAAEAPEGSVIDTGASILDFPSEEPEALFSDSEDIVEKSPEEHEPLPREVTVSEDNPAKYSPDSLAAGRETASRIYEGGLESLRGAQARRSTVSVEAWVTLFAAMIAAGLVVLFIGIDRIL